MPTRVELLASTADPLLDRLLEGLVELFDLALPERLAGVYLVGSRALGGAAVPNSDIDLRVILRGDFLPGELERFLQARQAARKLCPLELDCPALSETRLQSEEWLHEALSLKTAAIHLWGADLRPGLPLPSLAAFTRNVTAAPVRFLRQVHGLPGRLPVPLTYPDPQGEFYGYDRPAGEPAGGLKLLVHIAGFAATCRLALEAGQIVGRKEEWLPAYRALIHDDWLEYLEELYRRCKTEWQYRVPQDSPGRLALRLLCRRFLAFENDYLARYLAYLQAELGSGSPPRADFARTRLAELMLLK